MRSLVVLFAVLALPTPSAAASASTVVVVRPGDSIQAAVSQVASGGTVLLHGGTYHQRVRLDHVHGVTIRPFGTEHAVLSGDGLTPPPGLTALVEISHSADVTVQGLDITAYRTRKLDVVPAGIYVHGGDQDVHLLGNHVHDLGNDNNTLGSFDINAHGIAAYGDDAHASIRGLVIRGNVVDNLHLGASESVVVNGNVTRWSIVDNRIHDNDNIGIDAIGFESTLTGADRYTYRNRARYGEIVGNTVERIRSRGNPAYWEDGSWCNCADAIYVDGGTHIRIADNLATDSDIGIEVAAENRRGTADHVDVIGNDVHGSLFTGITTGGYCNGARACGGVETGSSHDNTFRGNVLRGNNRLDDGSPELLVQYHAHDNVFTHNTITATNAGRVVYGTVPNADDRDLFSDYNTFRGSEFGWLGHVYPSFAAYRDATGQDAHSTLGS